MHTPPVRKAPPLLQRLTLTHTLRCRVPPFSFMADVYDEEAGDRSDGSLYENVDRKV